MGEFIRFILFKSDIHIWLRNNGTTRTTGKLQVCENNWMRRMVGVKREDKRRWKN